MQKTIIITVAGVSSRFNSGFKDSHLKAIYFEEKTTETLLFKILEKCKDADSIIVVGGYKYDELKNYIEKNLDESLKQKIILVYNEFFQKYTSGYSLSVGLQRAFEKNPAEIIFIEGDLDIDKNSFVEVLAAEKDVLTYTSLPIDSKKSVVVYRNAANKYRYAFNSSHGLLEINEPFYNIYNSGQCWKFKNIELLKTANEKFCAVDITDTNLGIIQRYFENLSADEVNLIHLKRWLNCNTRQDYKIAKKNWDDENEND